MQSSPKVSHAYFPAFDLFRGVGILFVLLAHLPTSNRIVVFLRPVGSLGVHMFFALSGFLITCRLREEREQTGRINLRSFYSRRARRILPPALIYLLALALLGPVTHVLPTSFHEIQATLFFYRNVVTPPLPDAWYTAHFWSLSLEEQFYLVWPLFLAAAIAKRSRAGAMTLCAIAATVLWRIHVKSVDPAANIYRPDLLADHLLWGCLIGLHWKDIHTRLSPQSRTALGALGVLAATLLIYTQPPFWQAFFAFSVATGFILLAEPLQPLAERCRPLRVLGQASYDCYIWQSLFLPLPFPAGSALILQRLPWNCLSIAALTAGSFVLTFPRRAVQRAFPPKP